MTLEQYWSALRKRWKLIILCLLVAVLGAYIASKFMAPLYQSTTLVEITIGSGSSNPADINSLSASAQLAQVEAQLATSDTVLREVASHYPGLTAGQLAKEATTVPKSNIQLFEIDVLDPSPTRAAALAND